MIPAKPRNVHLPFARNFDRACNCAASSSFIAASDHDGPAYFAPDEELDSRLSAIVLWTVAQHQQRTRINHRHRKLARPGAHHCGGRGGSEKVSAVLRHLFTVSGTFTAVEPFVAAADSKTTLAVARCCASSRSPCRWAACLTSRTEASGRVRSRNSRSVRLFGLPDVQPASSSFEMFALR